MCNSGQRVNRETGREGRGKLGWRQETRDARLVRLLYPGLRVDDRISASRPPWTHRKRKGNKCLPMGGGRMWEEIESGVVVIRGDRVGGGVTATPTHASDGSSART
jgi:hypothetical protein